MRHTVNSLWGYVTTQLLLGTTIATLMAIAPAQAQSLVIVAHKQGNVQIQRGGGTFQNLVPGARLEGSDLIRVGSGGSVTILCGNLATQAVTTPGTFSVVQRCPMAAQAKARQQDRVRSGGDRENATLPYLLSPSPEGVIQSLTPAIRWHSLPEVAQYTVYLRGRGLPMQNHRTHEDRWVYDGEPLQYGRSYQVTIVAPGTACDRPLAASACRGTFMILTEAEVAEVTAQIADLAALNLPAAIHTLSLVEIYGEYELYDEAIELLEGAIAADQALLTTHIALAEFYEAAGRYQAAQAAYAQAWLVAQGAEDLLSQASIAATLGNLKTFLGERLEAIAWLEKAQISYNQLEDQDRSAEIAEFLEELRSP